MKGGPKLSLRPFLHRALQLVRRRRKKPISRNFMSVTLMWNGLILSEVDIAFVITNYKSVYSCLLSYKLWFRILYFNCYFLERVPQLQMM